MSFKVKICGLKTPQAVDTAVEAGASYVGFIFFKKSPRYIEPEEAAKLKTLLSPNVMAVSVTVNADDFLLDRIVDKLMPDLLQFHGQESPEHIKAVKARYGLPVMKAFSISRPADLNALKPYQGIADAFLFDAKAPKDAPLPGGNGISFDWSLLKQLDEDIEYMLSGGLNESNIADALNQTRTMAIDISSGVEVAPGVKDLAKIKTFFHTLEKALITRTPF